MCLNEYIGIDNISCFFLLFISSPTGRMYRTKVKHLYKCDHDVKNVLNM